MRFTKMHGTGNDYVYINLVPGYEDSVDAIYDEKNKLIKIDGRSVADVAIEVSDRHFGIGSDGLIAIAPSDTADVRMIMFNADGSEGAMCGNGIRCVAKYSYDHGLVDTASDGKQDLSAEHTEKNELTESNNIKKITVETASGIKSLKLTIEDNKCTYVEVNMGQAILKPSDIPVDAGVFDEINTDMIVDRELTVDGETHRVTCVSMVKHILLQAFLWEIRIV